MNRLLRTQLRRYFGDGALDPARIPEFLAAVDAAYHEADRHAERLVHSIRVTCEELEAHNAGLARRNAQLARLNDLVVDLAAGSGSTQPLLRITETCGAVLGAARASVWQVEHDSMRCLDLFTRHDGEHTSGSELHARDYPQYFAAIRSERSIAAHDAARDPRTREFADGYLAPLGITSMLDAGVFADGALRHVLCIEHTGTPRRWTDDEIAFAGSVADVMATVFESDRRREVQTMLDHQRSFLRQVIDLVPNLIYAKDRAGRFTMANDATAELFGVAVADLLGRDASEICPQRDAWLESREVRDDVFASLRERVAEEVAVTSTGERRHFHTVTRPIVEPDGQANMVLGVTTDVTVMRVAAEQRDKLEATLRQAQKLESLGLLAGGIAHDLNNILTPVLITASLMLETATPSTQEHDDIQSILTSTEAARELTAQLLAFGRKQVLTLATIDVNEVITRAIRMISRLVPATVRIETLLVPGGAIAQADATQINQVIVNLIMNACDAMPNGGVITCSTAHDPVDARSVMLLVEDTGVGMDETTLAQVFDPFFTTKERGRGTGLGLATVHGIVEQHKGTVVVESRVGQGTRFTIRLPRRERVSAQIEAPRIQAQVEPASTILLVEDESPIRRLVERVLSAKGYTILTAEHAEQALALVRAHPAKIDLLLTDVVLPGISGPALYDELRSFAVERVIFMSGHARDALKGSTLPRGSSFLRKPFTVNDLDAAVHAVLGR